MATTLVITVTFEDDSDYDFFRTRFVGAVESEAEEAMDDAEAPHADGNITVEWDVSDD